MGYRILIIEDDLAYKPLWAEILKKNFGAVPEIYWAVSAEEAMIQYTKSVKNQLPFHMIITDLFLAGSDTGLDFVENVCAQTQDAPPFVLISSVEKKEVRNIIHELESIANIDSSKIEILTKPINPVHFKLILKRITEHQKAV